MGKELFANRVIRAILVLACTITGPGAAPRSNATDEILLRYEPTLIALGFPNPLLRATVRGQSVWFIVDTGASVNTLASWLVGAAHLEPMQTTATVTGSTGAERPALVVANTMIQLDGGRDLTLREAIVGEFPSLFAEQRIGGLLSPQLLAPTHSAAVLDLRVPILRFEPFETAVARLGRNGPLISSGLSVCRNEKSPFRIGNTRLPSQPMASRAHCWWTPVRLRPSPYRVRALPPHWRTARPRVAERRVSVGACKRRGKRPT